MLPAFLTYINRQVFLLTAVIFYKLIYDDCKYVLQKVPALVLSSLKLYLWLRPSQGVLPTEFILDLNNHSLHNVATYIVYFEFLMCVMLCEI